MGVFGFATATFGFFEVEPRSVAGVFFADFLAAFWVAFFALFLFTLFLAGAFFGCILAFLTAARFAPARGAFRAFFAFRFLTVFFAAFATRVPLQVR